MWSSGENTRLPTIWPGFESRCRCHMWVELVVGSLPCSEKFFSWHSSFSLSRVRTDVLIQNSRRFTGFFQNNNLFIQIQGYLIGDQHPANRACYCLFLFWVRQNRASERTVFSLNLSSAGKVPFMASKAINMSQKCTFLGEGDSGVRDMASNSLWNLGAKFAEASFPHFETYFTQVSRCYL